GEGVDPRLVGGAVRGEQEWGGRHEDSFPACFRAIRSSALKATSDTDAPPFSETLLSAGRPLARRLSLASAAPTNPTGTPMTRAGSTSRLMISANTRGA